MDPYALLIIAQTQSLAERLRVALDPEQYLVRWVPSTRQALGLAFRPSLVILNLPPSGGARSIPRLKRQFEAPLLALSRTGQAVPPGADAQLARPFELEYLVDRIQTTLMTSGPHLVQAADMSLDVRTRRLRADGALHQLPPLACRILALLMARAGTVVPREELFHRVWETEDGDNTRVLDVHIAHLRRLLEPDPRHPTLIVTERGIGYRLNPQSEG
jgi:two-component system KDP operon response regulator KdpE